MSTDLDQVKKCITFIFVQDIQTNPIWTGFFVNLKTEVGEALHATSYFWLSSYRGYCDLISNMIFLLYFCMWGRTDHSHIEFKLKFNDNS